MTRIDRLIAAGLSFFSLVLCLIRYWFPPEAYFDEIYYPKSAAEYLLGQPQFEWTHPPLTKLLIAASMWLFGGANSALGNSGVGWRFLNVVIGALTVYVLYAFAKRLTRSTLFASVAATLLAFDGFHFTQSRIATPEIIVAFFCLCILYAFSLYLERAGLDDAAPREPTPLRPLLTLASIALAAGYIAGFIVVGRFAHQTHGSEQLIAAFVALTAYAAGRLYFFPRPRALPELLLLGLFCGLGAASKWNTLFETVLVLLFAAGLVLLPRPKWRLPLDTFVSVILSMTIAIYLISYIPFFSMHRPVDFDNGHDLTGFMDLQAQMFTYHDVTVAGYKPHPYSSKWWEWPLIYQPIAYWYHDYRHAAQMNDPRACCITEILALPNPLTWWAGLLTVPFLGYLAWIRRSRAYLLLLCAYFANWLPWIVSPRMLFEYHFFPNDAIILLADTLALQWCWERLQNTPEQKELANYSLGFFVFATALLFVYFYPVLAGDFVPYATWQGRMWFPHWILGPG